MLKKIKGLIINMCIFSEKTTEFIASGMHANVYDNQEILLFQ